MNEIYEKIVNKHDMILTELEEAVILHKLKTVEKEATYTSKKIEDIIDYWCKYYELERSAAEGGSRVQNLKMLRYCIFWSIKKKVVPNNLTMEAIGKIFNRHYSTVIHCMNQMEDWIRYDSELRQDLMIMLNEFGYRADWNEPLQELTFIRKGELYPSRL